MHKLNILTHICILIGLSNAILSVPFSKTRGTRKDKQAIAGDLDERGLLYKRDTSDIVQEVLYNQDATYYWATFTIGTPPQTLELDIDTGSSDAWVFDPSGTSITQSNGSIFYVSDSSTYQTNNTVFNITYGVGNAHGVYSSDVWGFNQAVLNNFTFAVVDNATSGPGIVGIGYESNEASLANTPPFSYPNFPSALKNAGYINSRVYSIWLNTIDADTGEIIFGGIDTAKFEGNLSIINLYPQQSYFAFFIGVSSVSIQGSNINSTTLNTMELIREEGNFSSTALPVLLDTGTTLTYLPTRIAQAINLALGNTYYTGQGIGYWGKPCSQITDETITYSFDNQTSITIKTYDLYIDSRTFLGVPYRSFGQTICFVGILAQDEYFGIFGDSFLRSAYVTYDLDNHLIGIAQTIPNATDSNVITLPSNGLRGTNYSSSTTSSLTSTQTNTRGITTSTRSSSTSTSSSTHSKKSSGFKNNSISWNDKYMFISTLLAIHILFSLFI